MTKEKCLQHKSLLHKWHYEIKLKNSVKKAEEMKLALIVIAKTIMAGVVKELINYNIKFTYGAKAGLEMYVCGLTYGESCIDLDLSVYPDKIKIDLGEITIATYKHLKWHQHFIVKKNKKLFYETEDAIKAISNMIIMNEPI